MRSAPPAMGDVDRSLVEFGAMANVCDGAAGLAIDGRGRNDDGIGEAIDGNANVGADVGREARVLGVESDFNGEVALNGPSAIEIEGSHGTDVGDRAGEASVGNGIDVDRRGLALPKLPALGFFNAGHDLEGRRIGELDDTRAGPGPIAFLKGGWAVRGPMRENAD